MNSALSVPGSHEWVSPRGRGHLFRSGFARAQAQNQKSRRRQGLFTALSRRNRAIGTPRSTLRLATAHVAYGAHGLSALPRKALSDGLRHHSVEDATCEQCASAGVRRRLRLPAEGPELRRVMELKVCHLRLVRGSSNRRNSSGGVPHGAGECRRGQ